MRNDLIVKATWLINNDNQNEIYLDYFNKKGKYVGNIIVDEIGRLEWHIIDALYQEDLFAVINYINGNNDINRLEFKEKDLDISRWERLKLFIQQKSIILNRYSENRFSTPREKVKKI